MKKFLYFSIIILLVASCNKEQRYSGKLMKGETWKLTGVYVDGAYYGFGGNWTITSDVNIYDSIPSAVWSGNKQTARFEWQFHDKGKSFVISYNDPTCINCPTPPEDLDFHCYFLSGKYDVTRHKKNQMKFVSTQTVGFPGQTVHIDIEKIQK